MRRVREVALIALCIGSSSVLIAQPTGSAPPPAFTLKPVRKGTAPPNPYPKKLVERGRTLVMAGGCNDCHTPRVFDPQLGVPVLDWSRMLSGHPEGGPDPQGELGPGDGVLIGPTATSFKLPFGTTYSMNLTPDTDTGTGTWTEKMFLDIFRKGRHLGGDGRPVYPPMPWDFARTRPEQDLRAIFAYLRSIPPLRNTVPTEKVPPPVADMIIALNNKVIALQADPAAKLEKAPDGPRPPALALEPVQAGTAPKRKAAPAAVVERGRKIALSDHCHVCHTPWVFNETLGVAAPDFTRMLSGHPEGAPDPQGKLGAQDGVLIGPTFTSFAFPFGVTHSRNLTPDLETGTGKWTEEQFLAVFRKARHPDGRTMLPPMPWDMIGHRSDVELRALFAFLQSIPPIRNAVPDPKVPPAVLEMFRKVNGVLVARER
jgi:mono/diheme cytochrome c family protein